jgi:colanic acid/amylovoran biosynthesis glycosyltransferase
MRVAYIVSRYPYVSHVFILREVLALRRRGAEIHTFTIRRPGPESLLSSDDREADATTFSILPPRPSALAAAHLRALFTRPLRYLSTLRRALSLRGAGPRAALWQLFYFGEAALMWRECSRRDIRHIHAHHANVASDVALLAAHLGGRGWAWSFTMHGSTEFFDVREHRLAQKVELAGFVVCVSHHGRSQLMSLVAPEHWDKLRVVHCGVDLARFAPPPDGRAGNGIPEILTVGRLVPVKGQELLIEALAELSARGVEARLTLVGDGPQRGPLRDLAQRRGVSERVEFAGARGQQEIPGYYGRADVFALPSFAEGLPVVLVEAMACALPVVASRITGIPELVDDGVSGRLFVPGRLDQLVDGLAAMGGSGRERVEAEFDVDRTAEQLVDVFAELAPSTAAAEPPQPGDVAGTHLGGVRDGRADRAPLEP